MLAYPPARFYGVDRGAFNPIVAATAAWMTANDDELSARSVDLLVNRVFSDKLPKGYSRKFVDYEPRLGAIAGAPLSENASLIQDALLNANAALRKVLEFSRPSSIFHDDEDFEADPVYVRAARLLDQIRSETGGMHLRELSICPQCGLLGDIEGWFGMRVMEAKKIRQSWCRVCRSIRLTSKH
jgi:hypothetical protein